MECEFFCKPGTDLEWFAYWKDYCVNWLKSLGIREENLRLRDHEPAELAFYSRATTDIEYAFPFTDWGELWGIADRTDYDLKRHQEASGKDLTYFDQETGEHYLPYVIEPSLGADRVALAFFFSASSFWILKSSSASFLLSSSARLSSSSRTFLDRKSTRLNSSHSRKSRMPSSA